MFNGVDIPSVVIPKSDWERNKPGVESLADPHDEPRIAESHHFHLINAF